MHPTQWVFRLIVIEFGDSANRLPCVGGVAVLAGDIQISVRTMHPGRHLRVRASRESGKRNNSYCEQIEYAPKLRHDVPHLHNVNINSKKLNRDDGLAFAIRYPSKLSTRPGRTKVTLVPVWCRFGHRPYYRVGRLLALSESNFCVSLVVFSCMY